MAQQQIIAQRRALDEMIMDTVRRQRRPLSLETLIRVVRHRQDLSAEVITNLAFSLLHRGQLGMDQRGLIRFSGANPPDAPEGPRRHAYAFEFSPTGDYRFYGWPGYLRRFDSGPARDQFVGGRAPRNDNGLRTREPIGADEYVYDLRQDRALRAGDVRFDRASSVAFDRASSVAFERAQRGGFRMPVTAS
jgi:hypothetical protein